MLRHGHVLNSSGETVEIMPNGMLDEYGPAMTKPVLETTKNIFLRASFEVILRHELVPAGRAPSKE